MKSNLLLSLLLIICISSFSQPSVQWQYSFGGSEDEGFTSGNAQQDQISRTSDGGYIFTGFSHSNDGDVTGHHGLALFADCWVVKLDSMGILEWQRSLGGSGDEMGLSVKETSDGGYIVVSTTSSYDGDVSGLHDTSGFVGDIWMVKLDSTGNILWQNCFGGTGLDGANCVIETYDSNYVAAGRSNSNDGDVSGNQGSSDIWVIKVSSAGTLIWQKCLGGTDTDYANNMKETPDHGIVLCGNTSSTDGDFTGTTSTISNSIFIMKIDSMANMEWVKTYGGNLIEIGFDIALTSNGGYALGSATLSSDLPGYHGSFDYWLLKLDSVGDMEWQNCYGGSGGDFFKALSPTPDNGYVLIGASSSVDGDVSTPLGSSDAWIVKTDSVGNIEWEHSYGGTGPDDGTSILVNPDGSIVFACESNSNDIDVSGHHGSLATSDCWIAKLAPFTTGISENRKDLSSISLFPNPANDRVVLSFDLVTRERVKIDLYDISGRIIRTVLHDERLPGANRVTLDLDKLSIEDGMYFTSVTIGQRTYTRKFIKE